MKSEEWIKERLNYYRELLPTYKRNIYTIEEAELETICNQKIMLLEIILDEE